MTELGEKNEKTNAKHNSRSSKSESSLPSSFDDMQAMKTDLQLLMTNFKQGKIQAFGTQSTRAQMDKIRHLQRNLAHLHFDLDSQIDYHGSSDSSDIVSKQNRNMGELLENMNVLGNAMLLLSASETLNMSGGSPSK